LEIDNVVGRLYKKDPTLKNGKFGYGYAKFFKKNIHPIVAEINEEIENCRIDNCLADEKTKEILYTADKQFRYDKEGYKKLNEFIRKINKEYAEKEVEVEPYILKDVPELLEEEKELLQGILI